MRGCVKLSFDLQQPRRTRPNGETPLRFAQRMGCAGHCARSRLPELCAVSNTWHGINKTNAHLTPMSCAFATRAMVIALAATKGHIGLATCRKRELDG